MEMPPLKDILVLYVVLITKSQIWEGQFWGRENRITDATYLHGDQ